uniref:Secreted protein n=1 Tax=Oryza nivara TaxID=4536 RepID=A0A0E0G7K1_ORYNI
MARLGFSALTNVLVVSYLNWCFLGGALQPRQVTCIVLAAKRMMDDRSTTPLMYWDSVASTSSSSHPVAPYSSSSVIGENLLFHELWVCSFRDSCLWRAMSLDTFLMITPFGPTGECLLMTTLMTRKGVRLLRRSGVCFRSRVTSRKSIAAFTGRKNSLINRMRK